MYINIRSYSFGFFLLISSFFFSFVLLTELEFSIWGVIRYGWGGGLRYLGTDNCQAKYSTINSKSRKSLLRPLEYPHLNTALFLHQIRFLDSVSSRVLWFMDSFIIPFQILG